MDKKCLALFIHGFWSKKDCWDELIRLLKSDDHLRDIFEPEAYPSYKTGLFNLHPLTKLPSISEIAKELATTLVTTYKDYDRVTLIGHSQGGLIIQKYLLDILNEHNVRELCKIQQVILIATPNLGAVYLNFLRRVFFRNNPQEYSLRVLNEEMSEVLRGITSKILAATRRTSNQWPVRIQCICGSNDRIVPSASAKAVFENVYTVNANHKSIIRPKNSEDPLYKSFKEALLEPEGHKNFWEIKLYETTIRVQPKSITPDSPDSALDNIADVTKSVVFSNKNRCDRSFVLDYLNHNVKGTVDAPLGSTSHPNSWSVKEKARYTETRRDFTFRFNPEGTKPYKLEVKVCDGYNKNDRSVSFNLGNEFYCKAYRFTLDLRKYIEAGWELKKTPQMSILMNDNKEEKQVSEQTVKPNSTHEDGCWTWEIQDIHNMGQLFKEEWTSITVHLSWDICEPAVR